ncbi:Trimethyllysine dioxygenase [Lepidopterella palustris CBS 459.81]|uniref:Trimethyllysine dioxygenase n=1 Tax=Lepidopterella palustris CBS 459.81 TaxID=1314670 RepID=A0A8E2EGG1_9PEZI|nr:Trimethyllysine dioxygenase [Lepidopterella palustris CBS 459.81]
MTTPPRNPALKHPVVHGNSIMVYSDKANKFVNVPKIWLRDNCQCSSCVHEVTKQRLLDTFRISHSLFIKSCIEDDHGIQVSWSDGHESYYTNEFLAKSALKNKGVVRQGLTKVSLWSNSIKHNPPVVDYGAVMKSDEGLKEWLSKIRKYGFCYVDGTPATPQDTQKLLERISFIRNTHYGAFYDFTSDLSSKDTAYTSIALDAHTDTTYFSDPAGLQAFHIISHTDGSGGASLLVDGFQAALDLSRHYPEAYDLLSTVNVHSHASGNDGISIQPYRAFPVLLHDPNTHHLVQVRWNSSDRAAVDMPLEEVQRWYDAAEKWSNLLRAPESEYWCQLMPGRVLVFDNWRVLHGRSAFTGKRRVCGGYINRDDYISKFKMLYLGQEEVLKSLAVA